MIKNLWLFLLILVISMLSATESTIVPVTYNDGQSIIATQVSYVNHGDSLEVFYKIPYGKSFVFEDFDGNQTNVALEQFRGEVADPETKTILCFTDNTPKYVGKIDLNNRLISFYLPKKIVVKKVFTICITTTKGTYWVYANKYEKNYGFKIP